MLGHDLVYGGKIVPESFAYYLVPTDTAASPVTSEAVKCEDRLGHWA